MSRIWILSALSGVMLREKAAKLPSRASELEWAKAKMWNYGGKPFQGHEGLYSLNTQWEARAIYIALEEMWHNFIADHLKSSGR